MAMLDVHVKESGLSLRKWFAMETVPFTDGRHVSITRKSSKVSSPKPWEHLTHCGHFLTFPLPSAITKAFN